MIIRKAIHEDMDTIMDIYARARKFMFENGNTTQWDVNYPSRSLIEDAIGTNMYVCTENEIIACVFYFAVEDDSTYHIIYNGNWLNSTPYGVVHRIASSGITKGAAKFCLNWAYAQCGNLRIDTHKNNIPMQQLLNSLAFQYCGIIHTRDGSERLAFQKTDMK